MRLFPDLALAALVAGVGVGLWLDVPLSSALPLLLLTLAAVSLAVVFRLCGLPAGPILLAAALLFGLWRVEAAHPEALPVIPTGAEVSATVRITDAPAPAGGRYRFRAQVVGGSDDRPSHVPAGSNLLVYALPPDEFVAQRSRPFLRYGDTLRLSGSLEQPQPIGDFDYAAWLESQRIAGVMWARSIEPISTGDGSKPAAALHRVRTAMASAIGKGIPAPQSGLVQALLLGIRTELPYEVKESFRNAGMSHLLAISGLHVGVVMALTLAAASAAVGRNHPLAVAVSLLVVWAYAVLSGLDPPVVRAAIMGSLFLGQGLLGRGMRGLTALLLTAALMLVVDPSLLSGLSFQLSFTAMAGVILALPLIAALTAAASAPLSASGSWLARWSQYGLSLLIASVVVSTTTTLATLPLVAWHFGEIPLMSVPATVLAMPAMPAALLGAMATALAGLLAAPLAVALGTLAWAPLAWLAWVADAMPPLLASAPWLTPEVMAVWLGSLGLLAALVSSSRMRRAVAGLRRRPRWRPGGLSALVAGGIPVVAIAILLLVGQLSGAKADGLLHVYVLDIGQGDAIFVVTPDGRQMLIDGGPDAQSVMTALDPLLPPGDRSLDVVAATHLDSDHVGGLLGVLSRYRAGVVLQSQSAVESAAATLYPQWQAVLDNHKHPSAIVRAGHDIALGRDVTLETLHPPTVGSLIGKHHGSNDASTVMRLNYGRVSFLLTGDIEADAERHLVATAGEKLRADVLKASHHGSRTSTTPEFLAAVNPRSAAVSAGRDNRFGHPHPDVMERLESRIGPDHVFLTARDGTVEYVSDGEALWVKTHGRLSR